MPIDGKPCDLRLRVKVVVISHEQSEIDMTLGAAREESVVVLVGWNIEDVK